MSIYEYFLIFLALIFCGYASYTDLKTQKIYNVCSLGLLYGGTLSQLMAWYLGTTTPLYILALFLGSGLMGFALYWFGVFSPGDSKLFWGLCLIFPLSLFRNLNGPLSFPPLILALNIIIPYSVGMLGYLLFRFVSVPNKLALFRGFLMVNFQKASLLEKLFNVLFFIGVGTALTPLLALLGWHPDPFLRLVSVLVTFVLIQKLLSPVPKTPVYYASVGFACVWLAVRSSPSVPALLSGFAFFLGLYLLAFVVTKQLVLSLARLTLEHAVDVKDLQIGMIPAEQIVRVSQPDGTVRYEKKQVEFSSGHDDNIVISPDPAGLDTEKIAQLQHLAVEGALAEFGNQIRVQPAIRFAPVITVGTLLTILCQGPFYLKLIQLF
ncbi:hypothetical protein F4X10_22370 [Candidatus Poribacteria bacterium]|nr:hypothetical protein [Candidatus Poribacteria bacterium]